MLLRRSLALRATILAAVGLAPLSAAAQEGGQPGSLLASSHFHVDLGGGLLYRLGSSDAVQARGGGMLNVTALGGSNHYYAVGVGYERSFYGREKTDVDAATFSEVSRTMDALWFLGRAYPYQNEDVAFFLQLGLGPVWQGLSANGTKAGEDPSGQVIARPFQCSAHDSAGLGLRFGVGSEIVLSSFIMLTLSAGIDHVRTTAGSLGGCAPGLGADTSLTGRLAFSLVKGHEKPPAPVPPPVPPPPTDRDGDGILDLVDACPDQAGVPNADPKKHGCPPPSDRDRDTIFDEQDACPDEPGVASDDPKKNGCPLPKDRDGDKVIDELDACPDIPGVATADKATNGCPPDTDGDGIRDDKDACPQVKGLPNEDPAKNGCPLVQVTEKEIVIGQQVQFEVDQAIIRPESKDLLDQVAAVIKDHPEILKLEVQGHTDNTGGKQRNKLLSQGRADAVKIALVKRGIEGKKLDAKGYGEDEPLADNATDAGKAKNRRVQFKIVQKKDANAVDAGAVKPAPAPGPNLTPKPAPGPNLAPKPAPAPAPKPPAPAPAPKPAPAPAPKK